MTKACLFVLTVSVLTIGALTKPTEQERLHLLHDHHYYVKPDVVEMNDSTTVKPFFPDPDGNSSDTQAEAIESDKPTIRHKAYKLSKSNLRNFDNSFDETLKVPPEDLKKWVKNNHTSIFEDSIDEESTNKTSIPIAIRKKTFYFIPNSVYFSRLVTSQKVIELAVFTDSKLYNKWTQKFPQDTTGNLRQYILAVVNNMNALYNQPSMTERISFRLVNIEILTSQPRNLNDFNGQPANFLRSFCAYAAAKNLHGTLWDHALLLTGVDLQQNTNQITSGVTWHSAMCVNGLSCSIVEGNSFASAFLSSHEIGHSLGMDHDGSNRNSDCDSSLNIMSPTTGGARTTWSRCSISNLRQFLTRGYNGFNPPNCLIKRSSKLNAGIQFIGSELAGQQFPAEVQCSIFCRNECTPYITNEAPYDNICYLLYCQQMQGDQNIIEAVHPALEGTPCGGENVCFEGKCQNIMQTNLYSTGQLQ